jgi:predicted glycosyltransferase/predicted transcriptional regulator
MNREPGGAPAEPTKIDKIWVAMSTPFQANFFAPLIKDLSKDFEFLVTARDHDNIQQILEAKHIEYTPVGKHGGRELGLKLEAYAENIQTMLPIVKREKPDLLLTERWPEAVRVAFGLNVPSWAIFYDEREKHVNQMVFPLASKVFVPRYYTFQELYANGVIDPEKVMWFNGFHTGYLKGASQSKVNPYEALHVDPPVVLVRPEPEFASFFPSHEPVLEKAVELVQKKGDSSIAVLPRTEQQTRRYSRMGAVILDESMSESPVAHADVILGAAETMLMEAFVLGRPAISAIYWAQSKPVVELHKYIPHSTNPEEIAGYVEEYLNPDNVKEFKERSSLIVQSMDNPAQMMADEIRRLGRGKEDEVVLKRRSKMEIYIDIINAASLQPLRPTHIMKAANISYNELRTTIESLEGRGLLREETTVGGKYYQATPAGLKLLQDYRELHNRLFSSP